MHVSRELDYAVRAVLVMATHSDEVLSKRRIADEFCIPVNFLAIILPRLVHSGIVESLPGPRGGYRMARAASEISILDIIKAINRGLALNRCDDSQRDPCDHKGRCPVAPHWRKLRENVEEYLQGVTFDSLVRTMGIGG